jgi:hypothetical protein
MTIVKEPSGWQLHHHEKLFFHGATGAPALRIKFFHYPAYHQRVIVNQPPANCTLRTKQPNAFYLFQQKVSTRGVISLERIISVYPQSSIIPLTTSWGRISDIPRLLQQKYKQSFPYWPIRSPAFEKISQEHWFTTDDVQHWVKDASIRIIQEIHYPEKQDKRLGADQALFTHRGDCDEFTDFFITLARMRGIPCRRLAGYFIHQKNNEAEPHAWAEVFSPINGWITIDIALQNIGKHTRYYVIRKLEEFNPALHDYQLLKKTSTLRYHWELPAPTVTPLKEEREEGDVM